MLFPSIDYKYKSYFTSRNPNVNVDIRKCWMQTQILLKEIFQKVTTISGKHENKEQEKSGKYGQSGETTVIYIDRLWNLQRKHELI